MTWVEGHAFDCFCEICRGDVEPEPACMGSIVCPKCGKFHGYCSEINNTEDKDEMIHRNRTDFNDSSDGRPRGGGGGRRRNQGLPYITAEKLTVEPTTAKILGARVQPDSFRKGESSVVVKLAYKGNSYLWTIRQGNPNLDVLCDGLGEDEEQWAGNEILMYIEVDDFDNKTWIRSEVPVPEAAASGRGRKKKE